jgi:hypothetical protein
MEHGTRLKIAAGGPGRKRLYRAMLWFAAVGSVALAYVFASAFSQARTRVYVRADTDYAVTVNLPANYIDVSDGANQIEATHTFQQAQSNSLRSVLYLVGAQTAYNKQPTITVSAGPTVEPGGWFRLNPDGYVTVKPSIRAAISSKRQNVVGSSAALTMFELPYTEPIQMGSDTPPKRSHMFVIFAVRGNSANVVKVSAIVPEPQAAKMRPVMNRVFEELSIPNICGYKDPNASQKFVPSIRLIQK